MPTIKPTEDIQGLTEFPEQGVAWRLSLVGQAVGLQLEGMGFVTVDLPRCGG